MPTYTPSPQEIQAVKSLADPYAKYSGFAQQPLALSGFSPEVVEALKFNDKGGKNIIIGGSVVERDPNFMYTPTSPVSSSTGVRDAVTNLGNGLTSLSNTIPAIYDPSNLEKSKVTATTMFDDRRAVLERRRSEEVARIMGEFDALEKKTGEAQKNEKGTTARNLVSIGGNLGGSASEQGTLLKLEAAHRDEMAGLVAKRQNAIAIAQNAYNDKDFELAQLQFNSVRDIDKDIYSRQKDFIDYTLDLRTHAREDQKMEMDKQKDRKEMLNFAVDNGLTKPFFELAGHTYDSKTLELIDNKDLALQLGVKPDMSNVQVIKPSKNYPAGMVGEYMFYVDQEMASGKQPVDFNAYQNMDANRKAKIARAGAAVTYNQNENETYKADVAQTTRNLKGVAGPDGYVSPTDWKRAYSDWTESGKSGAEFVKNFQGFVNPKNQTTDAFGNTISDYGTLK
jgi:hypothetical protein